MLKVGHCCDRVVNVVTSRLLSYCLGDVDVGRLERASGLLPMLPVEACNCITVGGPL